MAITVEYQPNESIEKQPKHYVGLSGDVKPTDVSIGSTFWAYDTNIMYKTYDGTNWASAGGLPGTITKTIQTPLKDYTALAANLQSESLELDLTNIKKVSLFIQHARDAANAFVGAGTEYRVLVSSKATGDDGWFPLISVVADIAAASAIATDADEAVGQTRIECGSTVPAVGDFVFFKNATIANSEMSKVIARDVTGGSEYFDILNGLTHLQEDGTYYNKGEKFALSLDVSAFSRLKVVCNNNNGSTNQAIVWKCEAITQT